MFNATKVLLAQQPFSKSTRITTLMSPKGSRTLGENSAALNPQRKIRRVCGVSFQGHLQLRQQRSILNMFDIFFAAHFLHEIFA